MIYIDIQYYILADSVGGASGALFRKKFRKSRFFETCLKKLFFRKIWIVVDGDIQVVVKKGVGARADGFLYVFGVAG